MNGQPDSYPSPRSQLQHWQSAGVGSNLNHRVTADAPPGFSFVPPPSTATAARRDCQRHPAKIPRENPQSNSFATPSRVVDMEEVD